MPQFGTVDYLLWAAGFCLRCYLLVHVPRKHIPFLSYILFFILRDFALLCVMFFGTNPQYYYLYWSTAFAAGAINLWNGVYIFRQSRMWLTPSERKVYSFSLHGLIGFAVVAALIHPPSPGIQHIVQILDRSVSIILVGLYFGILAMEGIFDITIRPRLRDIAAGFAIYKAVDLMRGALQVHYGPVPYVSQIGFLLALTWWAYSFRQPEPELVVPNPGEQQRLRAMLEGFAKRNTQDLVASKKSMSGGE
jgi:hypothetical protein